MVRKSAETGDVRQRLVARSFRDAGSGLPNEAFLTGALDAAIAIARKTGARIGLAVVRVAGPPGEAGRKLAGVLRGHDLVARADDGNFLILLPGLDSEADLRRPVSRLGALASRDDGNGLGVALYPRDGADGAQLIAAARQRLGNALPDSVAVATDLRSELFEALTLEQLQVWYQPKIELATGELAGAEALVRWKHPRRGLLSPQEFIQVAEDSGVIAELGHLVVETALRRFRDWRHRFDDRFTMAINIAAMQFARVDFPAEMRAACREFAVPPDRIQIEITETGLLHDSLDAKQNADQLAAAGFQLVLDDFGTGYSSLALLRRLPVASIKIDQSFVLENDEQMGCEAKRTEILKGIIALAHAIGLRVVAEGIETPVQADMLRRFGCDEGQGFHFGAPLPADRFARRWLAG